jgi:hypothetical protein
MSDMPWFRCWNESISDVKIATIAEEMQRSYHEVLGAWIMILCLASQSPERGKLLVTFQKRFTQRGISQAMKLTEEQTKEWLDKFLEMEMLTIDKGVYSVTNWPKRQPKSDNSTERVKKFREKRIGNVSETFPFNSDSDSDSLSTLRDEVIKLTGLQVLQGDIKTLIEWEKEQVIDEDIRDALQWRKDQGLQPVKTISQLVGGVATSRSRRIQDKNARKNGREPEPERYTAVD